MSKIKIGIVGIGMVGSALKRYFDKKSNYEVFCYDKGQNIGSMEEVNKADFVYVCVPTPTKDDLSCDTSIVEDVISNIKDGKVVIIKSTVEPGTTNRIQEHFPNHKILFNPEFLTELTADQDMCYPDRQIIGYTKESYNVAKDVIQQLPLAPFERIVPAKEAEMCKYMGNAWFSLKVVFANQIYDICQAVKIDYNKVRELASADKRIGRTHLDVWHKGYRGYGGKCLPKDIKALIAFAQKNNVSVPQLEITDVINNELTKGKDV